MTPLARLLRQDIAENGPIPLAEFIDRALFDPAGGYYAVRQPFGRDGDFITAPEISQVFGELLAVWTALVWQAMASPAWCFLVELGPGRGTMLADLLRTLGRVMPPAAAALRPILIERSPLLIAEQQAALTGLTLTHPPQWLPDLDDLPEGPLIVLANEFFDCLPVRQLIRTVDGWRERLVAADPRSDGFTFVLGEWSEADVPPSLREAPEGSIAERCPMAERLAASIATRIATKQGAALIIDYGHAQPGLGDTLQAIAGHRLADPLATPGAVDISHHVDFSSLAAVGLAAGVQVFGPIPQGLLLGRLGIAERAQALIAGRSAADAARIEGQIRRLVHPGRMGLLFKALAFADRAIAELPGFDDSPVGR